MLITTVALAGSPAVISAASYKDVSLSHYANKAIDWVSSPAGGNMMVGDADQNFHPNKTLDKFETAKILAIAAGYKYSASAILPAERELYDRAYASYKIFLDSMAKQYVKWNRVIDREIAYLLYREILTTTDVSRFVDRQKNSEEISILTKQEAIVYMVRLDGGETKSELIELPYREPYNDDASILAEYKKYVYYAKEAGIAGGADGYISPLKNITRAEMAQMLYNLLYLRKSTETAKSSDVKPEAKTVSGVIDSVFVNGETQVYLTSQDGKPSVFKLAAEAVVTVDGVKKDAASLIKGMTANGLVNQAGELFSLTAKTAEPAGEIIDGGAVMENEGFVKSSDDKRVVIETKRVRLNGEIVTEEHTFSYAKNCIIKRGEGVITPSEVAKNDIAVFTYTGSQILSITLQEKDRLIIGTLTDRRTVGLSHTPILTVRDEQNVAHELRVTETTAFTRNNREPDDWTELRIGDSFEAVSEYDALVSVTAKGARSTVEGFLIEIHIARDRQRIVIEKSDLSTSEYVVTPGAYDAQGLRIGMNLRLYLDSLEVYDVMIL